MRPPGEPSECGTTLDTIGHRRPANLAGRDRKGVLTMGVAQTWRMAAIVGLIASLARAAAAQSPDPQSPEPQSREAVVEEAQTAKAPTLHPYIPTRGEQLMGKVETILNGTPTWHPFFENAYRGGGLALGVGYMLHVSSFNSLDV